MTRSGGGTIEPEQRAAARAVGFLYVATMATAVFGETYVRGRMLVAGDAAQPARNIEASERLFRVGIVADLITWWGRPLVWRSLRRARARAQELGPARGVLPAR